MHWRWRAGGTLRPMGTRVSRSSTCRSVASWGEGSWKWRVDPWAWTAPPGRPPRALYASHVERTEVFLHADELDAYPFEIRRHARATGPGPWRRLDLTGWSRAVRGVPVYPQARVGNGLAEALAARYGDHRLIR